MLLNRPPNWPALALLVSLGVIGALGLACGGSSSWIGRQAPGVESSLWLNTDPLRWESLRGRVVLVEFWTFACGNCRNVEPFVKRWHDAYAARGLSVVSVHSPEFPFEADEKNLRSYLKENAIAYPVAVDNDFAIWKRWENRYWPALYLVDREGIVRHVQIGESGTDATEEAIRRLLD